MACSYWFACIPWQLYFRFLTGDVQVKYVKSSGRNYEFNLTNKSSTDQVIEQFRIVPDLTQKVIYRITKDVTGVFTKMVFQYPAEIHPLCLHMSIRK